MRIFTFRDPRLRAIPRQNICATLNLVATERRVQVENSSDVLSLSNDIGNVPVKSKLKHPPAQVC